MPAIGIYDGSMETRLLLTFLTLAHTESFTATAVELHLAQSTVTVQIRALERGLGTRLFDRLPRGARLTESGRRLLDEARQVLDAETRLMAAASEGGPVTGRVALGASETTCAARLPALVAAVERSYPGVEV